MSNIPEVKIVKFKNGKYAVRKDIKIEPHELGNNIKYVSYDSSGQCFQHQFAKYNSDIDEVEFRFKNEILRRHLQLTLDEAKKICTKYYENLKELEDMGNPINQQTEGETND